MPDVEPIKPSEVLHPGQPRSGDVSTYRHRFNVVQMMSPSTNAFPLAGLLWEIGGANVDVLRGCPPVERLKFSVLALLNVVLATLATYVAWTASGSLLRLIGIEDRYFLLTTLLSVFAFVVSLVLLISGVRSGKRRAAYAGKVAMSALSLQLAAGGAQLIHTLQALAPGSFVGVLAGAGLPLVSERSTLPPGSPVLAAVAALLFVLPALIAKVWNSPVYDLLASSESATASEPERYAHADSRPPKPESQESGLFEKETELKRLFAQYPDSTQLAQQLIKTQLEVGHVGDALEMYDVLIERDPRNVSLLKDKAQVYRDAGDEDRYRKTLEAADRILATVSFEGNVGKAITIRRFGASDLAFFADYDWPLQSGVNILLGRNGYGKTYLLRSLVAMLQDDEQMTRPFVEKGGARARMNMSIDRDGAAADATRSKLLFEQRFGKVPVLAIPDMRYVDKSKATVGGGDEVVDLKSQGAMNFLKEESFQGLILNFLYGLCLDQLDPQHRPDTTLIQLVEKIITSLSGTKFKFHEFVRRDSARFEILVTTDGSSEPLPIQKASQGTLSVVAMVGLIYRYLQSLNPSVASVEIAKQRAIVVIDEIDAHLHPSWQQKILQLFRHSFPNVQFIVTAHSPLVVAGARGGEVAVLAPAEGRFKVEVLQRHFIGATFEDLYTTIFGVERVDATFKRLGTQIGRKPDIEARIRRLESVKDRTAEDDDELEELRGELYYLGVYEEQQELMGRRERLEAENQELSRRNMELEGQLGELKEHLSRDGDRTRALAGEPTERTRAFFEDLIHRSPASATVVSEYVAPLIDESWPAVAHAALDALLVTVKDDLSVLKRMAVGYERLECFAQAREVLERAVLAHPDEDGLRAAADRLGQLK